MTDTPTPERGESDHITEALNDLERAVKCEYGFPSVHPAIQRKYDRDMSIVTDARKAYAALIAECARKDAEIARLRVQLGKGSTMNCAKCGGTGFVMSIHTGPSSGGMSYTKCDCGSYMVTINPGAPPMASETMTVQEARIWVVRNPSGEVKGVSTQDEYRAARDAGWGSHGFAAWDADGSMYSGWTITQEAHARATTAGTGASGVTLSTDAWIAPQGVTAAAIKQHVTQTRLHSESVNGNCMAACFASVLGGDIAEYDAILDPLISNGTWWDAVERIFIKHGFGVIRISAHYNELGGAPGGVCFASGVSPRGVRHMCVMKDGKIAHDPHPSRAGLDVIDDYTIIVPWALPQMPTFSTPHPGAPRDGE